MTEDRGMEARMARGNRMLAALEKETDRGKACVGDAILDELFKELFVARFIDDEKSVSSLLSDGRALGSHAARLKLAYLLGWIGPATFKDCEIIHRVRNKMAHDAEVDDFEHAQVRDLLANLEAPKHVRVHVDGALARANLERGQDKLLFSILNVSLHMWWLLEDAQHADPAKDFYLKPTPRE
jgi:DNA-binding MltR family transcriptional regulator